MKILPLPVFLILAASAVPLFASPETDSQALNMAKTAYVVRVLQKHVNVTVVDGVATLAGTTETQDGKDMVADTVSNIPGVVRVDDKIAVDPAFPEHTDEWMAAEVRLQLMVRAYASLATTSSEVKDGIVTLIGAVESQAQVEEAGNLARNVDGVKSVDNQISVIIPASEVSTPADESFDDASITAQVKYALLTDRGTSAFKFKVTTTNGEVIITGGAAPDVDKSLVAKIAQSIRGVKSVTLLPS